MIGQVITKATIYITPESVNILTCSAYADLPTIDPNGILDVNP